MATTRKTLAPGDPRHGTSNGYANHRCRCDACCKARTAYLRERGYGSYRTVACPSCGGEKTFNARVCRACEDAEREAPHGTASRYKRCHCDECRAAASAERKRRRHADLEATRAYDREYKRRWRAAA